MRSAAAVTGLIVSLAVASSGAGSAAKGITPATVLALESWVQAVKSHTPGRPDASAATVAALPYKTREDLNAGMGLFLTALMSKPYNTGDNKAAELVAKIGHGAGGPDAAGFLKRAVVLHSDAAAYGDLFPAQSAGSADVPPPARGKGIEYDPNGGMPMTVDSAAKVPPLLTNNRLIVDKDGQVVGAVVASWNWPFARSLLDLLSQTRGGAAAIGSPAEAAASLAPPRPVDDPFVGAWYHATTAYMFASGAYGDATTHLQRAAEVLPNDARILFDRASYAEILGLPMHQVLVSDTDRLLRRGSGAPVGLSAPMRLGIPPAGRTNAEAEQLFRRALEVDPTFVEARVRLARLLDLRNRHEEAAAELKTALAANPTGVVAFYAHLFAGRAAQALGKIDEAAHHYQDAAALFPDAQSALLGWSQVALAGSDVPAALAPVQRLGAGSAAFTADPWWEYHLAAGRDADTLLRAIWASVPR